MHKKTIAVVAAIAIALTAVGAVSAMGVYDNKSTETDTATSPNTMSEHCSKMMKKHGIKNIEDMTVERCMQMMEGDDGSQMRAQCEQMMQSSNGSQMMAQCMQMMNGNATDQTNSSGMGGMMNEGGMGGMMNGGGMGCH